MCACCGAACSCPECEEQPRENPYLEGLKPSARENVYGPGPGSRPLRPTGPGRKVLPEKPLPRRVTPSANSRELIPVEAIQGRPGVYKTMEPASTYQMA